MADAFIQLVKTITAPVVFLTVVVGIAALGDMARAGRLALRALGYFFVMTVIALALGLTAGNLFKPGAGLRARPASRAPRRPRSASPRPARGGESGGGLSGFLLDHRCLPELPRPRRSAGDGASSRSRRRWSSGSPRSSCGRPPSGSSAAWPSPWRSRRRRHQPAQLMAVLWGTAGSSSSRLGLGGVERVLHLQVRLIKDEPPDQRDLLPETVLPRLLAKPSAPAPRVRRSGWCCPRATRSSSTARASTSRWPPLFIVQAGGRTCR